MYEIKESNKFRKSFKKIKHSGRFRESDFEQIILLLGQGKKLPDMYHDHVLFGDQAGVRECHISGDCLLTYEINHTDKTVRLADIGNHANLFK